MSNEREIRSLIQSIAAAGNKKQVLFTVEVIEVQSETCTVDHNGIILTDIRLSAVIDGSNTKKIIKPVKGSQVLVADLSNGDLRDLAIIQVSETDSIVYNGGELGGLAIVEKIENNLKSLKNYVEAMNRALPTAFSAIGVGTAANGTTASTKYTSSMIGKSISFENMENTKIKH